jgi:Co/Zn/Cd efflux system component
MHSHSIAPWTHDHAFLGERHGQHERRTWSVVALTAAMMVAEIIGGTLFSSIALVADGWHMATHVAALAIAGLAYLFARHHTDDTRFSLGTGKFGELAAFGRAMRMITNTITAMPTTTIITIPRTIATLIFARPTSTFWPTR